MYVLYTKLSKYRGARDWTDAPIRPEQKERLESEIHLLTLTNLGMMKVGSHKRQDSYRLAPIVISHDCDQLIEGTVSPNLEKVTT